MGRKKNLNPMDAYRRKQKKAQIAKNKKKRSEAKDKALKKRDAEWIMAEIQKLNRRGMQHSNPCVIRPSNNTHRTEKQDRGKNEEKYANRRAKLTEAYERAIRIKKIKEKTQQIAAKESNSQNQETSPTPPPIEGYEPSSNNKSDAAPHAHPQELIPIAHPMPVPPPNVYGSLYANPLLMPQYGMNAIYSDTFGTNPNTNSAINPISKRREQRDASDPMNPANPKYNFIRHRDDEIVPHSFHQQMNECVDNRIMHKPQTVCSVQKRNADITKVKKPKHEIEVIMDPKLKMMRPSSMRFKRRFEKPKNVMPAKKRKLNIAPDVDEEKNATNVKSEPVNHRNMGGNEFMSGNADTAYSQFMDEIDSLIK